ncbi:MAG: hypothetical protein JNL58_18055 [Planctomyces sp.]|nr:hypothetical protein [Planctomyces sp.]
MKSTSLSRIVSFSGIGVFMVAMIVAASSPKFPIWLAIVIGVILGAPLIILGFQLDPSKNKDGQGDGLGPSNQFWPTWSEVGGIAAFPAYFAILFAPFVLLLGILTMLPVGDSWGIASARVLVVMTAVCIASSWRSFVSRKAQALLRGRVSDVVVESFAPSKPYEIPTSVWRAIAANWEWLLFPVIAVLVVWLSSDPNSVWHTLDVEPSSYRGFGRMLLWSRANPNTTNLAASMVGIGATLLFVYRVIQAQRRAQSASGER